MRRRSFTILTVAAAISLSAAIAMAALWIWANYARWGRIDIARRTVTSLPDHQGRPSLASERYCGVLIEGGSVVLYHFSSVVDPGEQSGWEFNDRVMGRNLREPGQWIWAASSPDLFGAPNAYAEVGVRAWLLVVSFAVLPLWWCGVALRRLRRIRLRHCLNCGYDLRATLDRCPECGAVPGQSKTR